MISRSIICDIYHMFGFRTLGAYRLWKGKKMIKIKYLEACTSQRGPSRRAGRRAAATPRSPAPPRWSRSPACPRPIATGMVLMYENSAVYVSAKHLWRLRSITIHAALTLIVVFAALMPGSVFSILKEMLPREVSPAAVPQALPTLPARTGSGLEVDVGTIDRWRCCAATVPNPGTPRRARGRVAVQAGCRPGHLHRAHQGAHDLAPARARVVHAHRAARSRAP